MPVSVVDEGESPGIANSLRCAVEKSEGRKENGRVLKTVRSLSRLRSLHFGRDDICGDQVGGGPRGTSAPATEIILPSPSIGRGAGGEGRIGGTS